MRRMLATDAVRQWRPQVEEVNLLERQFGVGVAREVEHLRLHCKLSHQKGH